MILDYKKRTNQNDNKMTAYNLNLTKDCRLLNLWIIRLYRLLLYKNEKGGQLILSKDCLFDEYNGLNKLLQIGFDSLEA